LEMLSLNFFFLHKISFKKLTIKLAISDFKPKI